jgi:signal transduction histidine kinase
VSGAVQVLRRIGSPDTASWPVFWLCLGFNVFLAFTGSLDDGMTLPDRIILVIAAQTVMMAVVVAYVVEGLPRIPDTWRPWTSLLAFAVAGLARGFAASVVYGTILGPQGERLSLRLVGGVISAVIFFVPATILVASWRDYFQRRADLVARREQLTQTAGRIVDDIVERDRTIIDRVRAELDRVLADADPKAGLQRLSDDVIRPLSHELADEAPTWTPPTVTSGRIRPGVVIDRASTGHPLMPLTTAFTIVAIALLAIVLAYGWVISVAYALAVMASASALLWLANAVIARVGAWPTATRIAALVLMLGVIGLVVGEGAQVLLPPRDLTYSLVAGNVALVVGFGAGYALARAVSGELRDTLDELRTVDDELTWQVARLRLVQWTQGTRFARALHGPVQGSIAVAVERLRTAPGEETQVLTALRASLAQSLDGESVIASWADGVEGVRRSWAEICEVVLDESGGCGHRLDGDTACREMALEVLSEAVSNAVRHGNASQVCVSLRCSSDRVEITVLDNGEGGEARAPGLGTRVLDSCALEWSRDPAPGASTLHAVLPLGTALAVR